MQAILAGRSRIERSRCDTGTQDMPRRQSLLPGVTSTLELTRLSTSSGREAESAAARSTSARVVIPEAGAGVGGSREQSPGDDQAAIHRPPAVDRALEPERLSASSVLEIEAASSVSMSARMGSMDHVPEAGSSVGGRRAQLLDAYQAAIRRPLDLERALAAIKLRRAAEIYCRKDNRARFLPRPPRLSGAEERIRALVETPIDELLTKVQANPREFSRTALTDVAQRHMLAALNIDVAQYHKGIHRAGLYEGLHSVAGRVASAVAAGISLGVHEVPGVKKAIMTAVKVAMHEVPPNVLNPALTGGLRTITDVKESFKRVGGQPVVAPQIETSLDMDRIVAAAKEKRGLLDAAISHFTRERENDTNALGAMVDAFLALHDVADREYRRRIGLNRTQTYSKGWGMAVNGVGVAGALVSATVPVVGQIAGPAILAATIPLQWGAGYLDERRNKHRYNLRANTKWGDFLKEEAGHIHFKNLTVRDVSESALRKSFMTQPEVQVAAIREVYEDALGELMRQHAELKKSIDVRQEGATPVRALVPQDPKLIDLENEIELAKTHVNHFESFDIERWQAIPEGSLIGKCLDDLKKLEKATLHARLRKPGERAQIVQRYVQAFQGGVSTGTALPIVDAITSVDSFYAHDAHGHVEALQPAPEAAAVGAGTAGGAVFTAATGEVRMSKADNKKIMARANQNQEAFHADGESWVFKAGRRNIDLRSSAGYSQHVHTRLDKLSMVRKALVHGLTSGPVGLKNLLRARPELRRARASLQSALKALTDAGLQRDAPGSTRARTISAMKDELHDFPMVRLHLGVEGLRLG